MGKRKRKISQEHIKKKIRKLERRLRENESLDSSDSGKCCRNVILNIKT